MVPKKSITKMSELKAKEAIRTRQSQLKDIIVASGAQTVIRACEEKTLREDFDSCCYKRQPCRQLDRESGE